MARKTIKSRVKATAVYLCDACYAQCYEKIFMCRGCKSMGIVFIASKAECKRYLELKSLEKYKQIRCLVHQPRYKLVTYKHGFAQKIGDIVLDFTYEDKARGWAKVYEDVKGKGSPISDLSSWKIRHFEMQYGFKVEIVRR